MRDIVYVLTIIALSVLLYKQCNKSPIIIEGEPYDVVHVVRDTEYVPFKVNIRDTVKVDTTIFVDVPFLDSAMMDSVLRDFYAKNVQKDTLEMKPFGFVYLIDTVQMNRISNRELMADLIFPIIRDTIFLAEKSKDGLYFGPRIDYTGNKMFVGPSLMYNKRKTIYAAGFGVGNGRPFYTFGVNFKL